MEKLVYEARPYLYVYGALMGFVWNSSFVMACFAALLGFCAATILYWRYQARTHTGIKLNRK